MTNWGIAYADYCTDSEILTPTGLDLIRPEKLKDKNARVSHQDLYRFEQLANGAFAAAKERDGIFVEVPHGSQSAASMKSAAACQGILASLRANGHSFYELNANDVKIASVNNKKATKLEMIEWATSLYPDLPWPTEVKLGKKRIVEGRAEHMADAVAVLHAGIQLDEFKRTLQFLKSLSVAS